MTNPPTVSDPVYTYDANPCPRATVVVTPGADNATVTLWRTDSTGRVAVRGAWQTAVAGPQTIVDYEIPFGRAVQYIATGYDATGAASADSTPSAAITADGDGCPWVQSPADPSTAQRWQFVEWEELERERAAEVLYPIQSAAAVVIAQTLRAPTCELVARTTTAETGARLRSLVESSPVLLIRCAASWGDGWTSRYWFPSTFTEARRYPYLAAHPERLWTFEMTAVVSPTANTIVPVYAWEDVVKLYATWADVIAAKATWDALYTNPNPGA